MIQPTYTSQGKGVQLSSLLANSYFN